MNYGKQVDAAHYSFQKYYFKGRWVSYWHEVDEILACTEAQSVLDVGPGTMLLKNILVTLAPSLRYESVDIAADVHPDHTGSVTALPLPDKSYDVVCAFQVLEHIEFHDVPTALAELKRVAKQRVLISLPHYGPSIELACKVPFLPRIKLAFKLPHRKRHEFQGQHYWEVGKRGYAPHTIRTLLQEHFTICSEYVPFENQYHRFYVLAV